MRDVSFAYIKFHPRFVDYPPYELPSLVDLARSAQKGKFMEIIRNSAETPVSGVYFYDHFIVTNY